MTTLKWGLIGCGDISKKRIAPALRDLENCELIAVNRANYNLAEEFAKEFGAQKWYKDWYDLVTDPEIEAVYIATPVNLHAEQTIAAAEAGKHVLCEKPMALHVRECDAIIKTCEKNHVKLGIAYYRHFYPVVQRIQEILTSGLIGQPIIAEINAFEWFNRKPGEPRYWLLEKEKAGGGPMMDFGCHRIEVMLHVFGSVRDIQSQLLQLHFERDVEDTAYVSLVFQQNVHGIIRVTHAAFEPQDTLNIYGTRGTLKVPVLNGGLLTITKEDGERHEEHLPHSNVHQPLIDDFTKAVLEDRNPAVDGTIGREVTRILDRIYYTSA
jgi:predicted dehydrogenase